MRKINGVPVEAQTDLSSLTGGEVLKWDATNTLMAWQDQDATGYLPLWYGGRGLFMGGYSSLLNNIQYITISSTGNALDFGDLTVARHTGGSVSNTTRGVLGGGSTGNTIDYITISTTGNATDFGDLTRSGSGVGGLSSGVRGVFTAGASDTMDYYNSNSR